MAVDTAQKRMSALHVGCPWRGPLVDATESGTTQGNRQAAAYLYSGIAAGGAPTPPTPLGPAVTVPSMSRIRREGRLRAGPRKSYRRS